MANDHHADDEVVELTLTAAVREAPTPLQAVSWALLSTDEEWLARDMTIVDDPETDAFIEAKVHAAKARAEVVLAALVQWQAAKVQSN